MGFLDFFVERDKKPAPEKTDNKTSKQEVYVPSVNYTPPAGGDTDEFTEHFKKILKEENERNFPGNDYYEFYVVKNGLSSLPEPQAYVVAFSGLSAAGLIKAKLLETAESYKRIVEREMSEFEASYLQMYNENCKKKEDEANAKSKELSELTERMQKLSQEIHTLKQEVVTNASRLASKKSSFEIAGNSQKQEIETEINKINQYIQ